MAGNKEKKHGRPGAKGVKLFAEGKYEEAINEFTQCLETMPDGENKKIALYNRGMSYHSLGQHDMALKDGESCQKIDPCWAKGYKCSGLALEALGKHKDAIDTLVNGQKMCSVLDKNSDAILNPLIERLNLVSGVVVARSSLTQVKLVIVCYEMTEGMQGVSQK